MRRPTPAPSRVWLTVPEAAARLALSERTIRTYISHGRLTAYRLGPKALRLDAAEVDAFGQPVPTASSR